MATRAEILSPSNRRTEIDLKLRRYREAAANLYALVIEPREFLVEIHAKNRDWQPLVLKEAGDLIDELLAFSKLGQAAMVRESVDMAQLVEDAIAGCALETEGRDICWACGALPTVAGDSAMLRLVVRNLVANALKYTRPRARAEITVGCSEAAAEWVFRFADNGVGFDSKDAENLFKPFHRLHTAAEFEGTGIGLAHVRRIIERHGGRVWAEGAVGQGATFYFSLPAKGQTSGQARVHSFDHR